MSESCNNTRDWKGVSAQGKSVKISKWVKYSSGTIGLSCKENVIQVNPSPRTVLGVTSQTPFTYLAQAIDLNFVQGGGGETLLGPVYECVLPVAANSIQKCVKRGEYWSQNLLTRIVVPIKKAHSNATNLFYWGNGNTYSKRHWITVRHTSINMVVLYRVTIS